MSKRHAHSPPDENPPKRRRCDATDAEAADKRAADAYRAVLSMCRLNQWEPLREILRNEFTPGAGKTGCTPGPLDVCDEVDLTPLMICAAKNYVECLVLLLEAGVGLEVVSPRGMTALLHAAYGGIECLSELVTRGASLAVDNGGYTALHLAASSHENVADIVRLLLKHGASIEATNNYGGTPLYSAVIYESEPAVAALLEQGASPNAVSDDGDTALHCALLIDNDPEADLVHLLLKHGAATEAVNKEGRTPLRIAIECGCDTHAVALLEAGARMDVMTPEGLIPAFHEALLGGLALCVERFVARGVSVSEPCRKGVPPIGYAAMGGSVAAGELLLQLGASVDGADSEGVTPLMYCGSGGHDAFAAFLLKHGADVDRRAQDGTTALHHTVLSGNAALCTMLVEHGIPLDVQDTDGFTALNVSSDIGMDVCKVLIDAGAQLDVTSNGEYQYSFLLSACQNGRLDLVKMLLASGAQLCSADDGFTGLMLAADEGHLETVRYLLGCKGVDVNHQGANRCTAMHRAAVNKSADVVKLLLQHGADKTLRDNDGCTARVYAIVGRCPECLRLLD